MSTILVLSPFIVPLLYWIFTRRKEDWMKQLVQNSIKKTVLPPVKRGYRWVKSGYSKNY